MEPVSAASAVVAILTPVAKLASRLCEIMRRLKSADDEICHLWMEVDSFRGILESLHTVLKQDANNGTPSKVFSQARLTPICDKVLLEMKILVKGVKRIEGSPVLVPWYALSKCITGQLVKWLFKQAKVAQLYLYLNGLKASLNLTVGIMTFEMAQKQGRLDTDERYEAIFTFAVWKFDMISRRKMQAKIDEYATLVKTLRRRIRKMEHKDHHTSLSSMDQPSLAEVFAQNDPFRDVLRQAENYLPQEKNGSRTRSRRRSSRLSTQQDHRRPPEFPNSDLGIVPHPRRRQPPRPPPPISPVGLQPMTPIPPDPGPLPRSNSHTRRLSPRAPSQASSEVSQYRGIERSRQGYGPLRPTSQYRPTGSEPTALFRGPDDTTEASYPQRPRYGTILLTSRQGQDDHSNNADSPSD